MKLHIGEVILQNNDEATFVSDANDSPRNDTYDVCGRHCRYVSVANYLMFQLNKHTTRENNNNDISTKKQKQSAKNS